MGSTLLVSHASSPAGPVCGIDTYRYRSSPLRAYPHSFYGQVLVTFNLCRLFKMSVRAMTPSSTYWKRSATFSSDSKSIRRSVLRRVMTETIVEILVQLISILAVATEQVKQGRLSESVVANRYMTGLNGRRKIRKEAFRGERRRDSSS
jgi:hypothetical protein